MLTGITLTGGRGITNMWHIEHDRGAGEAEGESIAFMVMENKLRIILRINREQPPKE